MKKLALYIILSILNITCYAQDYQKNGYPCVNELCVGDGLSELSKVNWIEVKITGEELNDNSIKTIKRIYLGNINREAIAYLINRRFDSKALSLISSATALCTEDNILLKGIYETESGNLTEVHIRLLPEENGSSEQKWTVVNIRRLVNVRMNDQDLNEAKKKLSERYKIFNTEDENGYQKTEPTDKGSFTFRGDSSGFYFDLEYSSPIYNYFHKSINPPPQCTKSINFD